MASPSITAARTPQDRAWIEPSSATSGRVASSGDHHRPSRARRRVSKGTDWINSVRLHEGDRLRHPTANTKAAAKPSIAARRDGLDRAASNAWTTITNSRTKPAGEDAMNWVISHAISAVKSDRLKQLVTGGAR